MGSPPLRTIKGRILTADSWVSDFTIYLNGNYFGIYQIILSFYKLILFTPFQMEN